MPLAAPTLAALALTTPSPGVRLTVTNPAVGSVTYTVRRSSASSEPGTVVRGASKKIIVGAATVADFEVPLGEAVTYEAVTYDALGEESTPSAPVVITVASGTPWLTDPLNPDAALPVTFDYHAPSRSMPVEQEAMYPLGSARAVVVSGRRALGTYGLSLAACTLADLQALRSLLLGLTVAMIRVPDPTWDVPQDYYALGEVAESRVSQLLRVGGRVFSFPATLTRRPDPSIEAPLWTYADSTATGRTYAQSTALGRTYLVRSQGG